MKKISLFFSMQLLVSEALFCMGEGALGTLSHNASLNNLPLLIQEDEATAAVWGEKRGRLGLHKKSASCSCPIKNSRGILRKDSLFLVVPEKQKSKVKLRWMSAAKSKFFLSSKREKEDCTSDDGTMIIESNEQVTSMLVPACCEIGTSVCSDGLTDQVNDVRLPVSESSDARDFSSHNKLEESRESLEAAFIFAKQYKKIDLLKELQKQILEKLEQQNAERLCALLDEEHWLITLQRDVQREIKVLEDVQQKVTVEQEDCTVSATASCSTNRDGMLSSTSRPSSPENKDDFDSSEDKEDLELFAKAFMEPYVVQVVKEGDVAPLVEAKKELEQRMQKSRDAHSGKSDEDSVKTALVLAHIHKSIPLFKKEISLVKKRLKPYFTGAEETLSTDTLEELEEALTEDFTSTPLDNKEYNTFFYALMHLRSFIPKLRADFLKKKEQQENEVSAQEPQVNKNTQCGTPNETSDRGCDASTTCNDKAENPFETIYRDAVAKGDKRILEDLKGSLDVGSDLWKRVIAAIEAIDKDSIDARDVASSAIENVLAAINYDSKGKGKAVL